MKACTNALAAMASMVALTGAHGSVGLYVMDGWMTRLTNGIDTRLKTRGDFIHVYQVTNV